MNDLISSLNDLSAVWLPAIARASLQGGIFVAAVWVLCRVFRGLPASVRYWIWWIACAQWMVRLLLVSPIALPVLPAETVLNRPPAVETSAPISSAPQTFEAVASYTPATVRTAQTVTIVSLTPASFGMLVWALGLLTLCAFSARKLSQTRRIVLDAQPIDASSDCQEIADKLSTDMGIRTPILRESEAIRCPMLAGWFRPTILLPLGFSQNEPKQIIRLALAHEMAHIRRRDLWFGAAPALSQLVLFFHPLAWLAVHEAAAAREESCDIEALQVAGGTPATYARLLLDSAQANSLGAALGAAFGYRLLHRRIKMLNHSLRLDSARTRRAASLLVLASALCSLPWTVTGQTPKATKPSKNQVTKTAITAAKSNSKKQKVTAKTIKKGQALVVTGQVAKAASVLPFGQTVAVAGNPVAGASFTTARSANGIVGSVVAGQAFSGTVLPGQPFSGTAVKGTFRGKTVKGTAFGGGQVFRGTMAVPEPVRSANAEPQQVATGGGGFGGAIPAAQDAVTGQGGLGGGSAGGFQGNGGGFGGGGFGGIGGGSVQGEFQHMEAKRGNGEPEGHFVTVRFKNIDIRSALTEMFHAAGVNFVLRSGVGKQNELITCELSDRPLTEALEALLKGSNEPLTYRVEGNVYYVVVSGS